MFTFLCVVYLICEIIMVIYLLNKIRKCKQISLKDTAIYPFLMLVGLFVMCTAHTKYFEYANWLENVTYAFSQIFDIVKLSIDTSLASILYEKDAFMLTVYFMLYAVSALALFSLSLSLVKTIVKNAVRIKFFKKEINYIFGLNGDAEIYIRNLTKQQRKFTCVVLKQSELKNYSKEKLFLDENGIKYFVLPYDGDKSFNKTLSRLTRSKNKKYCIITFFDADCEIYDFVTRAQNFLRVNGLYGKNVQFIISASGDKTQFVRELIKGNPDGITVENAKGKAVKLQDESRGNIVVFDKYEIKAFDFILNHNLAKYFPESLLNGNCTVSDCDINLYVLGLGKVNQAILKDILVETQFVTVRDKKLTPLRLNVFVYDKGKKLESLPLSYGLLKYTPEDYKKENYFELPESYSAHVNYRYGTNTGEAKFINRIYDEIKERGKVKPQVNYFLVSLDSDCENSLVAKRLKDSLCVLGENCFSTFFIRCRHGLHLPESNGGFIYFGSESSILTYENVVADAVFKGAKTESCIYQGSPVTEENITKEWCTLSQIKQQSNLYSVASLPFKFSLLRFKEGASEEEFFARYDPENDRNNYVYSEKLASAGGKFSARDVLAFSEHERWNAFELSVGAMPMKIKNSLKKDGEGKAVFSNKSENEIYHLCITTAHGLNEYYDYVTKINKDYGLNETADVIKYDYDLMDNVLKYMRSLKNTRTDGKK